MATVSTTAVRDNSTLANFKQWAQVISNAFTTFGWVQSADTGQVNWSSIASVPALNAYVYEIWKPNDGLTTFYLKVEYGTGAGSGNTNPRIRLSVGTSTNGAGALSGLTLGTFVISSDPNVTSTSTQFNCYLSGDAGRFMCAMWVNDTTNAGPQYFAVERSKNSSGSDTSMHVTLILIAHNGGSQAVAFQTLVFGVGTTTACNPTSSLNGGYLIALKNQNFAYAAGSTDSFSGNIPFSPVFPDVGYFDNPLLGTGVACIGDVTDQTTYSISGANMPYGVSHTYMAFKNAPLKFCFAGNVGAGLLMRYD